MSRWQMAYKSFKSQNHSKIIHNEVLKPMSYIMPGAEATVVNESYAPVTSGNTFVQTCNHSYITVIAQSSRTVHVHNDL